MKDYDVYIYKGFTEDEDFWNECFKNQIKEKAEKMEKNNENEKFSSCICKHVFDRIKIEIIDNKNDEEYQLDMPLEIYEELKKLIIEFEKEIDK